MCSKCHCCSVHNEENINHIFIQSDLAKHVWSYFKDYGVQMAENSVQSLIFKNASYIHQQTSYDLFILAAMAHSLWEMWKARNVAKYDGKVIHKQQVLQHIIFQVKYICSAANLKEPVNTNRYILEQFGINSQSTAPIQLKIIKWSHPPWPSLKLNTDGACKINGDSGGGGIIRDNRGNSLLAFSHYYGKSNSLIAEA